MYLFFTWRQTNTDFYPSFSHKKVRPKLLSLSSFSFPLLIPYKFSHLLTLNPPALADDIQVYKSTRWPITIRWTRPPLVGVKMTKKESRGVHRPPQGWGTDSPRDPEGCVVSSVAQGYQPMKLRLAPSWTTICGRSEAQTRLVPHVWQGSSKEALRSNLIPQLRHLQLYLGTNRTKCAQAHPSLIQNQTHKEPAASWL